MPDAGSYRVVRIGERSNGGITPLDSDRMGAETPPSWMPYFGHEDVERLVAEIGGLGGRVFNGRYACPRGRSRCSGIPRARCSPSGADGTTSSPRPVSHSVVM